MCGQNKNYSANHIPFISVLNCITDIKSLKSAIPNKSAMLKEKLCVPHIGIVSRTMEKCSYYGTNTRKCVGLFLNYSLDLKKKSYYLQANFPKDILVTNDRDYWLQQDLAASRRRNNSVDSNGIFYCDVPRL